MALCQWVWSIKHIAFFARCYTLNTMEFDHESVVRGYHVYKDVWQAERDKILPCVRETTNRHNPFAIAILRSRRTVGHVPHKISSVCSMFLKKSG